LILQRTKTLENLFQRFKNRYVEMTSYMTSSKCRLQTDGHLTKAFQKEKHA